MRHVRAYEKKGAVVDGGVAVRERCRLAVRVRGLGTVGKRGEAVMKATCLGCRRENKAGNLVRHYMRWVVEYGTWDGRQALHRSRWPTSEDVSCTGSTSRTRANWRSKNLDSRGGKAQFIDWLAIEKKVTKTIVKETIPKQTTHGHTGYMIQL